MKKVINASVVQAEESTYEPIDEGYENWEKEMRNNPEFQKLAKLCHLHGYQLHEAHNEKYSSGRVERLKRTIHMTPNESRAEWAKYLPEIRYRHSMRDNSEEFKAQTTSYGTLSKEEFSLFTTAIKHAQELLDDLTDAEFGWNFDSLYVWEFQEQ